MVRLYNYGSFWGVGTLAMNDGEQTWENREIHLMTTQMVRDRNYSLAIEEEMPLSYPYLGRDHHTHGILPPVEVTEEGPKFSPLDIPFPPDSDTVSRSSILCSTKTRWISRPSRSRNYSTR